MKPMFDTVEESLRDAGALGEASEIHGEYCGLVCLMGQDATTPWVAGAVGDSSAGDLENVLERLAVQTWNSLEEGNMEFSLLLPPDETPLESRAESLGLWCQGFVHGLGLGGTQGQNNPIFEEGVTRDIVKDFSEISRAAFSEDETEGEGEAAYMELVEYARVSVQLVFEELQRLRASPAGPAAH
jgi:uncharacterized protein YgfB (UPF0149 family)